MTYAQMSNYSVGNSLFAFDNPSNPGASIEDLTDSKRSGDLFNSFCQSR